MSLSLYQAGNVIIITGFMGKGKSDFGLKIGEIGIYQDCNLFTNIYCEETDFIKVIRDDIELFQYLIENKDTLNIICMDEGAVFSSSKRSGAIQAVYLDNLVFLCRKFNSMIIFIVQRKESALKSIKDLAFAHIHKINKTTANVEIEGMNVRLENIDRTNIEYDTRSMASFKFKLDITAMLDEISGVSLDMAYEKLSKILDEKEKWFNKEHKEYLIKMEEWVKI